MRAYKAFNADMTCRGFQFEVGQTYEMDEAPHVCKRGFHACRYIEDTLRFYLPYEKPIICEVELLGDISHDLKGIKCATNKMRILRQLSREEVIDYTFHYYNNAQKPHAYLLVAYVLMKYYKVNLPDYIVESIPEFVKVNLTNFGPKRIIPQVIRVADVRTKACMIRDVYVYETKNQKTVVDLLKDNPHSTVQLALNHYKDQSN